MTSKIEIRVRPVARHLVTVWQEGQGSRVIGEFESPGLADEVATALQAKIPRATVVSSDGAVLPGVRAQFLVVDGAVYLRSDSVSSAAASVNRGKEHTNYPSRYAIGEKVLRKACDVRVVGGILRPYAAEPAEITAVHFYPGKVCYQVSYPSGRAAETVDSVELEDLS